MINFLIKLFGSTNPKAIHGEFIKNPKCEICGSKLTHEWLGGDYSLLMCNGEKCWDKKREIEKIKLNNLKKINNENRIGATKK